MKSYRGFSLIKKLFLSATLAFMLLSSLFVSPGCRNSPSGGTADTTEIFVANLGGNSVMAFQLTGNGTLPDTPVRVIRGPATGLQNPFDVAIDGLNRIWVANLGNPAGSNPSITVYEPNAGGNAAPSFTFSFVNNFGAVALPGSLAKFSTEAMMVTAAFSETRFPVSGNTNPVSFDVLKPVIDSTSHFTSTFFISSSAMINPTGVAFRSDTMYVAISHLPLIYGFYPVTNPPSNAILKFPRTQNGFNHIPVATITGNNTGLSNPAHIEFDDAGNLFVLNRGTPGNANNLPSITVYGPGQSGNAAPLRVIRGQNTGLVTPGNPYGLAVNKNGRIFVSTENRILVFEPGANGNVQPFDILENTDLSSPVGIAVREK